MKLIIDMPADVCAVICSKYDTFPEEWKEWGLRAIKEGTALPEKFGRLIDADNLNKRLKSSADYWSETNSDGSAEFDFANGIKTAMCKVDTERTVVRGTE